VQRDYSLFRIVADDYRLGLELGADAGANVNLDDFMVYEGNEEQSRGFFLNLFHRHLAEGTDSPGIDGLSEPRDLMRMGFTEKSIFDELGRAAEGVPRDALYKRHAAGLPDQQVAPKAR
jgi:hypothetical protein